VRFAGRFAALPHLANPRPFWYLWSVVRARRERPRYALQRNPDMAAPDPKRPTYATEAIPSDVKNGLFLGNAALDNVVSCVIAMGAELWSTKRRLHVMEAVMAKNGITPEMIEKYVPSEAEKAAWESDRDRFVDLTLGPLANEGYRPVGSNFPKR
jgi:hypothetical protein